MKKNMTLMVIGIFLQASLAFSADPFPVRAESAQNHFEKGLQLKNEGKIEEAEWNLKRALEFEPENPDYHFELANIYAVKYDRVGKKRVKAGNIIMLEYAARELEQVIMLNPDAFPAIFNLGVVRKKQGKYEDSRENFKDVLQRSPEIVNAHLQIASTYEEQGFFEEARDHYEKAMELDYGNLGIRDSMDGLKDLEAADREGAMRRHYNSPYSGFQFSDQSRAREYQNVQYQSAQSQAGALATVPYLAMWLADQFMKLREGDE